MKFCLNARQSAEYLKKADEIKFEYRDRKAIGRYCEDYPEATIILQHFTGEDPIDWQEMKVNRTLTRNKLILCTNSLQDCLEASLNEFPFYLDTEITSFYQLRAIVDMGVKYIRLGAPLFFKLDVVKTITDIPIRAIPNIANRDLLVRENGVYGTWIRPEDVEAYDEYISVLEFEDCNEDKEQAMFRIYAEQHAWPGPLQMIVSELNHDGENRMISSDGSRKRINCGQRCQENGHCHICERLLNLANEDNLLAYKAEVLDKNE